jgi:hypothetical protein
VSGMLQRIRRTAQVAQSVSHFCLNPLCLHVAGKAKCKLGCCKVTKRSK